MDQINFKYQILERQILLKSFPHLSESSFLFGNQRLVTGSNTMAALLGNQAQAPQGNPPVPAIAQGGGGNPPAPANRRKIAYNRHRSILRKSRAIEKKKQESIQLIKEAANAQLDSMFEDQSADMERNFTFAPKSMLPGMNRCLKDIKKGRKDAGKVLGQAMSKIDDVYQL